MIFRLAFLLSLAVFPWLVLGAMGGYLVSLPVRLAVFCLLVLPGAVLFRRGSPNTSRGGALLVTALVYGTASKLASFIPDVSTYPLSLGWSEASRYFYASLFFSERLYGFSVPLSVLHPTRYLMQAAPYLLPDSPLWLHRLWQVILWIVTAALTSWLLTKRLSTASSAAGTSKGQSTSLRGQPYLLAFTLFAFLFLFQGPVYYHLLVMVCLVLWGFDKRCFWRTLLVVLVASAWAGVSRVNWLPVPGMLAAAMYFLQQPVERESGGSFYTHFSWKDLLPWRYLLPPAAWVILGTLVAYTSQHAYQLWSGNPIEQFGSSFSSDLLWYRLLPNPTYPLGILPSAILVSLPGISLIALRLIGQWRLYHPIRILGLAMILLLLFTGGVIVSVKIGGGSNLHNLDAFLVLLLVTGSSIYLGKFQTDSGQDATRNDTVNRRLPFSGWVEPFLLATAVAIPLYFTINSAGQLPQRDFAAAQAALQIIRENTAQVTEQGGEVLFISQRHLLTFDLLSADTADPSIPLVADYELVFLMEMAMAGNRAFLDAFQEDIQGQRFALIISGPLNTNYQGRAHSFGEENDAWVREVSEPVLCAYQPLVTLKDPPVQLLVPRQEPCR